MEIPLITGKVITLKNVLFPYRGDELVTVLKHKKEAGWSVRSGPLRFHRPESHPTQTASIL